MFAALVGPYPHPSDPGQSDLERVTSVLRDQLEAGLGMLTDGQVRLARAATGSAEGADSIVEAWQRAEATLRDLVTQLEPGLEAPLIKACLVGPYSAVRSSDGRRAAQRRAGTLQHAEELNAACVALFRAGAPVVQLAEDQLTLVAREDDDERGLAAEALRRATQGLPGHVSLSVSGGNADAAGANLFFDLPVASYVFDLINGPDNWRLIAEAPADRGVICGVVDARQPGPDDEAVMIWAARYAAASNGRGLERVGLAPSAGIERLPREAARAKIGALAQAARKAGLPPAELAAALDPRAVDARSGALGEFDPEMAARLGGRLPGRGRGRPSGTGRR